MASPVEIRIVYDNSAAEPSLRADWGFAAVVDAGAARILFDAGADGAILLGNLAAMGVAPASITHAVISHRHPDHRNGLFTLALRNRSMKVFFLDSFPPEVYELAAAVALEPVRVREPAEIAPGVFSTGLVPGDPDEQALVVETGGGLVVLTGCSHPGVATLVEAACRQRGAQRVRLLAGGFHLFRQSDTLIERAIERLRELGVEQVAPAHCTGERALQLIRQTFGPRCRPAGAGRRFLIE
jgi:7,8-dihydropterin-6-yl-methyl-4-(beta-D-ribofuranosyl)aminobenzene 5'-phosphate synthase